MLPSLQPTVVCCSSSRCVPQAVLNGINFPLEELVKNVNVALYVRGAVSLSYVSLVSWVNCPTRMIVLVKVIWLLSCSILLPFF